MSCLVVAAAAAAWLPHDVAGAAQTAPPGCDEIAPVLFTPSPASLDLSRDAVSGAATASTAAAAPVPQNATKSASDNGDEEPSVFAVSFTSEPACELPPNSRISLAHSVLLSGPANSTNAPIVTNSDLVFTEIVSFNGAIETLGTLTVPGLRPGSWTGTLPLVFSAGPTDSPTELGSAALSMTIKDRQGWWEGFPYSPAVLFAAAILGGLVVGLFRMLSATEDPDSIALQKRLTSEKRPVPIQWQWRNVAAVILGILAGMTAVGAAYIRNPGFAVSWDSSMALFAAVGGATLTAFVAAFKAPTTSTETIKRSTEALADKLEVRPVHGAEGDELVIKGPSVDTNSSVYVGPTKAERVHSPGKDHSVKVRVPPPPDGAKEVVVSVVDAMTGRHSDEVPFTYDS